MLLCFVDESFKDDFYGFAGVLADENTTKSLARTLSAIMAQAVTDFSIEPTAEIHGYPMFHGSEDWQGVPVRARIRIYEQVINAIVSHDVRIFLRSVSKSRLAERQAREHYPVHFPPEQVCFQHILQRADTQARKAGTYALMIADERGDRERHRERFAIYQTKGTPGVYMHTTLERLLDTVHFAPSKRSRMLQAADILAYTYQRRTRVPTESDPRAEIVMARMWGSVIGSGRAIDVGSWP